MSYGGCKVSQVSLGISNSFLMVLVILMLDSKTEKKLLLPLLYTFQPGTEWEDNQKQHSTARATQTVNLYWYILIFSWLAVRLSVTPRTVSVKTNRSHRSSMSSESENELEIFSVRKLNELSFPLPLIVLDETSDLTWLIMNACLIMLTECDHLNSIRNQFVDP